ncbi:MAG: acyl-CoA/acyl-ACP dehydrogenase [Acidobacteriota bacterium]|nr:acyl-CoA/acyl-ACP dehydrogenase [Acidobacteriota bacterium]
MDSDELLKEAARIAREVAGPASSDVDERSRFPAESVEALRHAGLLGALIPTEMGGLGASLTEVAACTETLAAHCASTAMVFAMHQIQVACLVRHGHTELLGQFTRDVARLGLLLASATTEMGVGGDVRTSICAVEADGDEFAVTKMAPVISYAEEADAVFTTARRAADSPSSDQVIVVCRAADTKLERLSEWNALGFRGTCSNGYRLDSRGPLGLVVPDPYAAVSSETMLPVSHVLWASVWLGLANGAMDRARRYVQAEARSKPGVLPPAATRLAEAAVVHAQFKDMVAAATARYEALMDDRGELSSIPFVVGMNALKVSASTLVVDVVSRAMGVCGISAYRQDGEYSLGRYLRDAYGAALMVNNERIHANNAHLLLADRRR